MGQRYGICSKCFQIRALTNHHCYPRRFYGKKNNDSKVLLCEACHQEIEKLIPYRKKLSRRTYIEIYKDWILGNQPMIIHRDDERREDIGEFSCEAVM